MRIFSSNTLSFWSERFIGQDIYVYKVWKIPDVNPEPLSHKINAVTMSQ